MVMEKSDKLVLLPPRELGPNLIQGLARLREEAPKIIDVEVFKRRMLVVEEARTYAKQFGREEGKYIPPYFATRLTLERRLGELLARTVHPGQPQKRILIPDENTLPEGITWNLSSAAQALAKTPKRWFNKLIIDILSGERRLNVKEIYLEARRIGAGVTAIETESDGVILGDFREVGKDIPDNSVALIFTDPPYDRASLPLYGEVASLAKRVLLPGGSLIVYGPNYALPEVMNLCGEHLSYWWTLAFLLPGDNALMREFGVRVGWKPLVWFTKGGRFNKQQLLFDVIQGGAKEKTEHEWQQQIGAAESLIRLLTAENDLVLDPMCGSATTLLAARRCGRRYLGIEVKAETVSLARERMANHKI
jgi:hypothetical protein